MVAKLQGLKRVVWIGLHVDILEYMKMSEIIRKRLNSWQEEAQGLFSLHIIVSLEVLDYCYQMDISHKMRLEIFENILFLLD